MKEYENMLKDDDYDASISAERYTTYEANLRATETEQSEKEHSLREYR